MSVSVTLVRALVEDLARAGADTDAYLAAAGLDPSLLEDPGARIDDDHYDRLHVQALDLTGDPALGLHLAERARLGAFSVVGMLSAHCRTIRHAVEMFARYRRLLSDVDPPSLIEREDDAILTCHFVRGSERGDRLRAEYGVTALIRIAQAALGMTESPRLVEFAHAEPSYAAEYQRVLACPVLFDRSAVRIHLDRALLDRPQILADRDLFHLLQSRAVTDMAALAAPPPMSVRARAVIVEHYDSTRPAMEDVARRLGISARSLRRRLHDEGRSFADVVDDALAELARHLLMDPALTIQEIAERLGFSEPSAFHRAFKRWTGLTPGQFRGVDK